jgi:hypothetical protein
MRSRGKSPRTTHATLDPITPQSGLFRAVADNPKLRPKGGVVLEREHDGMRIQYRASNQCDHVDWRTFLAIAAMSGIDGERFNARDVDPPLPTLWDRFLTQGVAETKDGLRLRTTSYAILKEAGLTDTGPNRKRLTETLIRLSSVRQFLFKGSRVVSGSNLLSFAHDEDSGELAIALSPQMARTILGESKQFVRVSLADVRTLKDSAAVILHGVFSARLRPRDSRPASYHVDTLADLAFGPTTNAATRRKRRGRIKEALADLARLPQWQTLYDEERHVAVIWRGDPARISDVNHTPR